MTLAEALANVELEAGQTYACLVKGRRVIVQVAEGTGIQPAARFDESDVMLDPWCDLPSQGKQFPVPPENITIGKLPIDIPYIPQDDE